MSFDDLASRLWPAHKLYHFLKYDSKEEEGRRFNNFKDNNIFINNFNTHNQKYHSCRHNRFSHWSHQEYIAWLTLDICPPCKIKEPKSPMKQNKCSKELDYQDKQCQDKKNWQEKQCQDKKTWQEKQCQDKQCQQKEAWQEKQCQQKQSWLEKQKQNWHDKQQQKKTWQEKQCQEKQSWQDKQKKCPPPQQDWQEGQQYEEDEPWEDDQYCSQQNEECESKTKIVKKPKASQCCKQYTSTPPPFINWRVKNRVTYVKDQDQLSSSWAFSVAACMESMLALKTNKLITLSEQQLVDCVSSCYDASGNTFESTYDYIYNCGLMKYDDYPYVGEVQSCMYQPCDVVKIKDYYVTECNEYQLRQVVSECGPVSVAINASSRSFQFYGCGIFYDPDTYYTPLNHAALLVGYGYNNDMDYWYMKNSWGTEWGNHGYVYIHRDNHNYLGVGSCVAYPQLC